MGGALASTHPVELLAHVLHELIDRNDLDPILVDDVVGGCLEQSGEQAGNIVRTAALSAGFPESVPATTVSRGCGSSQQATRFAAQGIMAGNCEITIACGVESVSRTPIGTAAGGRDTQGPGIAARYPNGRTDHTWDHLIAGTHRLDPSDITEYWKESNRRAASAVASGFFDAEIVPIDVTSPSGESVEHCVDETIAAAHSAHALKTLDSSLCAAALRRLHHEVGGETPPMVSAPLTDGASALLIMSESAAQRLDLSPRAWVRSYAAAGGDPRFISAIVPATRIALERAGIGIDDLDAYEVNETLASVPLMWADTFGADHARLNPRGGALALGHSPGASGTRLITTLVNHLEATGGRYGLQAMYEGSGMANVTVIERL